MVRIDRVSYDIDNSLSNYNYYNGLLFSGRGNFFSMPGGGGGGGGGEGCKSFFLSPIYEHVYLTLII